MKVKEAREFLIYDPKALETKGITKEYLKAAIDDKDWKEFYLSDKYDGLLKAVKASPYERARAAYHREDADLIIDKVDKVSISVTMLSGVTLGKKFFQSIAKEGQSNFNCMLDYIKRTNNKYTKRRRVFINEYLAEKKIQHQQRKKRIPNYYVATNTIADFVNKLQKR